MNRIVIALFVMAAIFTGVARADELEDKISIKIPPNWRVLDSNASGKIRASLYHIRTEKIGSEEVYSNAAVQYYSVPASVTGKDADHLVSSHTKGGKLILSAQDAPEWKTYLLVNYEEKQQFIWLYRIGIVDGVSLEFLFTFPHIVRKKDGPVSVFTLNPAYVVDKKMSGISCYASDVQEMMNLFNSVCKTMKISGKGEYKADVRIVDKPDNAEYYRYKAPSSGKEK